MQIRQDGIAATTDKEHLQAIDSLSVVQMQVAQTHDSAPTNIERANA